VRCCYIAAPPVRTLRVVANRETEPVRQPSTLPEAYCSRCQVQSRQGHRLSWDLPSLSLVPPGKRLSSSHNELRHHLLCTFQQTKHLPLQGCNAIGTIHTSTPDLSSKKQLSMHITSHSEQFDTIFHTPLLSKRKKGGRWESQWPIQTELYTGVKTYLKWVMKHRRVVTGIRLNGIATQRWANLDTNHSSLQEEPSKYLKWRIPECTNHISC